MRERYVKGAMMRWAVVVTAAAMLLSLAGCGWRQSYRSTSVVEYLYPKKQPVVNASIPHLMLPLRVGIAFVPGEKGDLQQALSEQEKMVLMKRIAAQFKQYPFVKGIELIPTMYLAPGGSFTNLDQIRTMFDIDVIVLLSYNQVRHTDEDFRSISYWTLIGAYIVRGELNDTSTMLDAAVYHIPSRKLLFRAPGISRVKGNATPISESGKIREDSSQGFDEAQAQLVVNLKEQLEEFKLKIKDNPQDYRIEQRQGYTGGGSVSGVVLGMVAVAGTIGCVHRREQEGK